MKQKVLIILIILWMGTIFYLSSENSDKSSKTSGNIIEVIANGILKNNKYTEKEYDGLIEKAQFIIRKTAHFTIYLIGGILFCLLYKSYGVGIRKVIIYSLVSCIFYAITDEIHQSFVPGRGPHITDVIIDSSGATCGVLVTIIILNTLKRLRNKKRKIKNKK